MDDQVEYWDTYYARHQAVGFPSPFAVFCAESILDDRSRILELGSGNGRDSFYFSSKSHDVIAIDRSASGVALSRQHADEVRYPGTTKFIEADFTRLDADEFGEIDAVYSRFTLHSVDATSERRVVDFAWNALSPGGRFLVEARTINDPLYGQGTKIGRHEYFTDHYRRHIDAEEFVAAVQNRGFRLEFFHESNGLAVFKDEDPVVLRLVAIRP